MTDISLTKVVGEWSRAVLLSPEAACIVLIAGSGVAAPQFWSGVHSVLDLDQWPIAGGVIAASVSLCVSTTKQMSRITNPGPAKRQILIAWPDYRILSLRVRVGFGYSMLGGVGALLALVWFWSADGEPWAVTFLVAALGLQVIVLLTMLYAAWCVNEVIDDV